jgi:hypothetical protein
MGGRAYGPGLLPEILVRLLVVLVFVATTAGVAGFLAGRRPEPSVASTVSPYAADSNPVRGLTAREVDDLLNGRGAGFARTAELNSYPGPRHAIDLADRLELTADQRAVAGRIFEGMSAKAQRLGREILERERRFSAGFAERRITPDGLRAEAESLGVLYGRLRAVHLAAHLELTRALTPQQIRRYDMLRGYHASAGGRPDAHVHGG